MLYFIVYFITFLIFITIVTCILNCFEYIFCVHIKKQAPFVPTCYRERKLLLKYIRENYPNAKTFCDVGSGWGGVARYIASKTNISVIGLENMPFSVMVSKILNIFCFGKIKTIKCDAFEYLKKTKNKFDILYTYLSPDKVSHLLKYKNKFKVLITADFEIPNIKPDKIIPLNHGYTLFNNKKYPHTLYIYVSK